MFFRLLFLLLIAILVLAFCSNQLCRRRAALRVLQHGWALANESGREIELDVLKEIASNVFRPTYGDAMWSGRLYMTHGALGWDSNFSLPLLVGSKLLYEGV